MFSAFRKNLQTVVIAATVAGLVAAAPALAAIVDKAIDSDKVDNKHAVSSSATSGQRAGKLVATNSVTGKLPNNIIAKAPDSDEVDGKSAVSWTTVANDRRGRLIAASSGGYLPNNIIHKAQDSSLLDGLDSDELGARVWTWRQDDGIALRCNAYPNNCTSYYQPTVTLDAGNYHLSARAVIQANSAYRPSVTNHRVTCELYVDDDTPSGPQSDKITVRVNTQHDEEVVYVDDVFSLAQTGQATFKCYFDSEYDDQVVFIDDTRITAIKAGQIESEALPGWLLGP